MPLQQWSVSADGGFLAVPELSKKLLKAAQQRAVLRQFTVPLDAFGTRKGDTFNFDRAGNVGNAGSTAGILESQPMPETAVAFTQGSVVVTEYGNSIRSMWPLDVGVAIAA